MQLPSTHVSSWPAQVVPDAQEGGGSGGGAEGGKGENGGRGGEGGGGEGVGTSRHEEHVLKSGPLQNLQSARPMYTHEPPVHALPADPFP